MIAPGSNPAGRNANEGLCHRRRRLYRQPHAGRPLAAGHEVCVYDNFDNSSPVALARVRQLTNRDMAVVEADVRDDAALTRALTGFAPDAVVHFAGLKAVGESNDIPLCYYQTNVTGTMNLLAAMDEAGAGASSLLLGDRLWRSAIPALRRRASDRAYQSLWTHQGDGRGRDRRLGERDLQASAVLLRYFNPVGAHESGRIGEDPQDIPNNLMPFVAQVAVGRRAKLSIFGDDYDTRDGTGERDYIHVVDLLQRTSPHSNIRRARPEARRSTSAPAGGHREGAGCGV
jgi:UDP-glucose 4-epimerase